MENDINDLIIEENKMDNIFQLEFSNRNLAENIKFRNWKKNMTIIEIILFFVKKEKMIGFINALSVQIIFALFV